MDVNYIVYVSHVLCMTWGGIVYSLFSKIGANGVSSQLGTTSQSKPTQHTKTRTNSHGHCLSEYTSQVSFLSVLYFKNN